MPMFLTEIYNRQLEGVGGLLTEFDSEESPLSTARMGHRSDRRETVWYWRRNERCRGLMMISKDGNFLVVDETSNPIGASPNSSVNVVRRGTGRMLS